MLSTAEAAKQLGVSQARVRQLLESGKLGGVRLLDRVWAVDERSVADRIRRLGKKEGRPEAA